MLDGRVIGITSGTFDLFHVLHLEYLEACRNQCDFLLVGVDSDALTRKRKGPDRPIITQSDRCAIVGALSVVGGVFLMHTYAHFWEAVQKSSADKIFKNQPFNKEHGEVGEGQVVIIPDLLVGTSTSGIIRRIQETAKR